MTDGWMANGVQLAWLIDPRKERVWIYRAGQASEEIADFSQSINGENILPGFVFDLHLLKK